METIRLIEPLQNNLWSQTGIDSNLSPFTFKQCDHSQLTLLSLSKVRSGIAPALESFEDEMTEMFVESEHSVWLAFGKW